MTGGTQITSARRDSHAAAQPPAEAGAGPAAVPGAPETQDDLALLVAGVLRANSRLNYIVRCSLAVFGLSAGVLALLYTTRHANDIAGAVAGTADIPAALFTATLPVLLFALLGTLAGAAAWAINEREIDEMYSSLDTISRMRREGEVAVSARGLIHAFEEKLQNARRAFTLLLWLGRTLFLVCLGLFAAAIVNAIAGGHVALTGALGASSVVGALLGVVKAVPRNVAHHLADVVQIQSVITGFDRQISLLESAAFHAMHDEEDRVVVHDTVLEVQERMDSVVQNAIERIERFADPEPGAGR